MRKPAYWTGVCNNCGGPTSRRDVSQCRSCRNEQARELAQPPREYRRDWHLTKKYNIDSMDFDCLWIAFKGKCGICGCDMEMPQHRRGQSLRAVAVDHDHATGHVRGLLCNKCNKGLGMFDDDVERLQNAIKWLEMCNEKISIDSHNSGN